MPHQKVLHNSKSKELVWITGRQVGKTVAIVNEIIKRAISVPKTRNWYVTNSYTQAKRNVWDLFRYYCPKEAIDTVTSNPPLIRLRNGSLIELIGVENAEQLRGAAVHFMALDEYADFPRKTWPTVLRPMFSTTGGTVWFVGTPKGLGNDLYDKYQTTPEENRFIMPACKIENGRVVEVLSKYAGIEELQKAYDGDSTQSKEYFAQEYLAEFTRPAGTVYAEWKLDNFTEVPYNLNLPLYLTMDFGVNDPTAIIWIQPAGSEYRVIDYYEASNGDISHFAQVINSKPYKKPTAVFADPAGDARSITTNTSPIEEYRKLGIYIRTKPGVKINEQIMVTHKIIPSLYVDKKAERFRDILLNYRYPEKSEKVVNQSNEMPIHDEWSHGARALEYFAVNYIPPVNERIVMPVYQPSDSKIGI